MRWKRNMTMVADFNLKMHQKRLAAGLHLDLLGELTALPQIPYMDLRDTARVKRRGRKRQEGVRGTGGKGQKKGVVRVLTSKIHIFKELCTF